MNSQICLTLQKIILPKQIDNVSQLSIYILSDSGFQHSISNRIVKNHLVNLFGQKIFLPYSTKQILFEISDFSSNKQKQRICGFYCQIQEISFNSKRQIITACNQKYNDFQLIFSIKLSIELDSETINVTESEFSQFFPSSFFNKKSLKILCPEEQQHETIKVQKIYSPLNVSSKFLELKSLQNWDIKSDYSPSKNRKYETNQESEDERINNKQDTFESMTLQSVSVKKKPAASKIAYKKNEQIKLLKINSNDSSTPNFDQIHETTKHSHEMDLLIKFKNYIFLGGLFGVFSAIVSHELLIY